MAGQKTTLRDIAELVGMSVSTVSRALKGDPEIAKATRERVRHAAKVLDYRPNIFAQGLSTKNSRILALFTPPLLIGSYFGHTFQIFESYAQKHGYYLFLCSVGEGGFGLEDYLPLIKGGLFAGVFFFDYNFSDLRTFSLTKEVEDAGVPYAIVYDDPNLPAEGHNVVRIDFEEQARIAVRHLLDMGRQHVAMVTPIARTQYLTGYLRAYREADIPVNKPELYNIQVGATPDGNYLAAARKVVDKLLALDPVPTGVFVPKSVLVGPLQRALREKGLRLPEDMAIVVTKDVKMYGFTEPPLTAVTANLHKLAETAIELMVSTIEKKEGFSPHTVTIPSELTIRESCGSKMADAPAG
jgi:LacI family transcriptional regulator